MCSASCLMLYVCEKFHNDILKDFQLSEQTQVRGRNGYVQCSQGNNSKSSKPKLWFMCSACHHIMLYICVKFRENISEGVSYGADTNDGSTDEWTDRQMDTQNFGEYNMIPLPIFMAGHKKMAGTDGRTDTQNFGGYNIIPSPLFVAVHKSMAETLTNISSSHTLSKELMYSE